MNKPITFRMVTYTDAAGKYMEGACRNGNEDNFYVDDNLGDDVPNHCLPDEATLLSPCGLLMAVADGMGGMNAGEIASQIATETVKEYFLPGKITPKMAATHESRKKYLEEVIVSADAQIKKDARHNPGHEGMGSTIILGWMVDDELTISWCGDSRAYRFNPLNGIELLSEDHSYVQSLVQQGVITYEQTFDHPQGNIVTRSLGDPGKKAQPETRLVKVNKGDVILLCSDGLSGVLRDRKLYEEDGTPLPGETLEEIIRQNSFSMKACREALWAAAERADWYDNVTAILCQVVDGAPAATKKPQPSQFLHSRAGHDVPTDGQDPASGKSFWKKTVSMKVLIGIIAGIALILIGFYFGAGADSNPVPPASDKDTVLTDSTDKKVLDPDFETKKANLEGAIRSLAPANPKDSAERVRILNRLDSLVDASELEAINQFLQKQQEAIKQDSIDRKKGSADAGRKTNAPGSTPKQKEEKPSSPAANELNPSHGGAAEQVTRAEGREGSSGKPDKREESVKVEHTEEIETTGNAGNETGAAEEYYIYKVKANETLYSIHGITNVSVAEIKRLNNLKDDTIKEGMELRIPKKK